MSGTAVPVNCGTARPCHATHHARPNLPLFNTEATAAWSKPWPPSWRLTPDAACWPGCGATGASHCTACPHDLDCLRPRQQRWRRAGGRAPFGPRWAQSRHQLAGHHRDITARRAPVLGKKARHCTNIVWADTPPTDLTEQDLCIDALLGIGVRSSTRPTPSAHTTPCWPSGWHNCAVARPRAGGGCALWTRRRHRPIRPRTGAFHSQCDSETRHSTAHAEPVDVKARTVHRPRQGRRRAGVVARPGSYR